MVIRKPLIKHSNCLFNHYFHANHDRDCDKSFLLSETTTPVMVHDDDEDVIECYNEEIPVLECPIELVSWDLKFLGGHMDAQSQGAKRWIDDMMTSVEFGSQSIHITVVAELPSSSQQSSENSTL